MPSFDTIIAQAALDAIIACIGALRLCATAVLHFRARSIDNAGTIKIAHFATSAAVRLSYEHLIVDHVMRALLERCNVTTVARRGDGAHASDIDRHVMTTMIAVQRKVTEDVKNIIAGIKSDMGFSAAARAIGEV